MNFIKNLFGFGSGPGNEEKNLKKSLKVLLNICSIPKADQDSFIQNLLALQTLQGQNLKQQADKFKENVQQNTWRELIIYFIDQVLDTHETSESAVNEKIEKLQKLTKSFSQEKIDEKDHLQCLIKYHQNQLLPDLDAFVKDKNRLEAYKKTISRLDCKVLPVKDLKFQWTRHIIRVSILQMFDADLRLQKHVQGRLCEQGFNIRAREEYKILIKKSRCTIDYPEIIRELSTKNACLEFLISESQKLQFRYLDSKIIIETAGDQMVQHLAEQISRFIYQKQLNQLNQESQQEISLKRIKIYQMEDEHSKTLLPANQPFNKVHKNSKECMVVYDVEVVIYYKQKLQEIIMESCDQIICLRQFIDKKIMPLRAQLLYYVDNNDAKSQIYDDDEKPLYQISPDAKIFISLNNRSCLEFYGFNINRKLDFSKFSEFFIEDRDKALKFLGQQRFGDEQDEQIFFDFFLRSLYSAIKKRFPIVTKIDEFKKFIAEQHSKLIWAPSRGGEAQFNPSFILMYLLKNAESQLKIQLMNLTKGLMPQPIYLKQFDDITRVHDKLTLNKQLMWIMKQQFIITSIGLHPKPTLLSSRMSSPSTQTGKSYFLNKIFFTQFPLDSQKHQIIQGVPYIAISVCKNALPLSVIDIPKDCPQEITDLILANSSMIILNSWKNQKQTQAYLNELKSKYKLPVITFLRDAKKLDPNILHHLKNNRIKEEKPLALSNFKESVNKQLQFNELRNIILSFISDYIKQMKIGKKAIKLAQNKVLTTFNSILSKIKLNMYDLCPLSPKIAKLKQLQMDNKKQQAAIYQKQLQKSAQLHPLLIQILMYIQSNRKDENILMQMLRNSIKSFNSMETQKFLLVLKVKKQIQKMDTNEYLAKLPSIKAKVKNAAEKLSMLDQLNRPQNQNPQSMAKMLDFVMQKFETELRNNIFSVQLFWRQIYAYIDIQPDNEFRGQKILDFIIQLKKEEVINNQPFEIIDGDNLEMPRKIIRKIFQSLKEKCIVLSIFGPQSSGKSTLLNFLFGCDFATSEGRCTRGVYGTFFKFSNRENEKFEGVFLIDTEGIFAVTNEKDKQTRNKFDSKLIMFCLAVSDLVIFNVRGNVDYNAQKLLTNCYDRREALNLTQAQKPQIILVLNINNASRVEESNKQIKKLEEKVNLGKAHSLKIAYDTKDFQQNFRILTGQQSILKMTPRVQFLAQTSALLADILDIMRKRQNIIPINKKIDTFELIWETVVSFPNLSHNVSEKYRDLEKKIKIWRDTKDKQNFGRFQILKDEFRNSTKTEQNIMGNIDQISQDVINCFNEDFRAFENDEELHLLLSKERESLHMYNNYKKDSLRHKLRIITLEKNTKKEKFEGDFKLRQKQREIIRQQNNGRNYSETEKKRIFDEVYEQILQGIEKITNIDHQIEEQYKKIRSDYNFQMVSTSLTSIGLPKQAQFLGNSNSSKQQFFKKLQKIIFDEKLIESKSMFIYNEGQIHTNIFKAGQTHSKRKYFDISEYFEPEHYYILDCISKHNVRECINMKYLKEEVKNYVLKNYNKQNMKQLFDKLLFELNCVLSFGGYKVKEKSSFTPVKLGEMLLKRKKYNVDIALQKNQQKHNNHYQYYQKFQFLKEVAILKKEISKQKLVYLQSRLKAYLNNGALLNKMKEFTGYDKTQIMGVQESLKKVKAEFVHFNINMEFTINPNMGQRMIDENQELQMMEEDDTEFSLERNVEYHFSSLDYDKRENLFDKMRTKNFDRIDKNKFLQKITKKDDKVLLQSRLFNDSITVYRSEEVRMKPLRQYQDSLSAYLNQDTRTVIRLLSSAQMQNFVFMQLMQKSKISLLLNTLKQVIERRKQMQETITDRKALIQIINDVNTEIQAFNNDLNQVSCRLTPNFIGKVHSIMVYLVWKLSIESKMEQKMKPYKEKFNKKKAEWEQFLARTSKDKGKIHTAQATDFIVALCNEFKEIQVQKINKIIQKAENNFINRADRRQELQRIIDTEVFSHGGDKKKMLQYLLHPNELIEAKYKQMYQNQISKIKRQFSQDRSDSEVAQSFTEITNELFKILQSQYAITQQKGRVTNIFEVIDHKSSDKDVRYDEEGKQTLFAYFIDLVTGQNINQQRRFSGVVVKAKHNISLKFNCHPLLKRILKNIQNHHLGITNIWVFLDKICKVNFHHQITTSSQIDNKIIDNFKKSIEVVVCDKQCPCCGRICGFQNTHPIHQCLYGHQMRAIAGNYLLRQKQGQQPEKQSVVMRCEDIKQTDILNWDNNEITWTAFKDQWSRRDVGAWSFEDATLARDSDERKKMFKTAWALVGPEICKKRGLKFVQFNKRQLQVEQPYLHYLFTLDESGSMGGRKWKELMQVFAKNIQQLRDRPNADKILVTAAKFSTEYEIVYERKHPNDAQVNLRMGGGGTDFTSPFNHALRLTNEALDKKNQILIFSFMTDGEAAQPVGVVNELSMIKKQKPQVFHYFSVEFKSTYLVEETMKRISQKLQGSTEIANDIEHLNAAYKKVIEFVPGWTK